jgi:hypothetical protein
MLFVGGYGMFRRCAAEDIAAVVRAELRTERKVFRQSNRWLWEPPLKKMVYERFVYPSYAKWHFGEIL